MSKKILAVIAGAALIVVVLSLGLFKSGGESTLYVPLSPMVGGSCGYPLLSEDGDTQRGCIDGNTLEPILDENVPAGTNLDGHMAKIVAETHNENKESCDTANPPSCKSSSFIAIDELHSFELIKN